jgi:hypothetical protein
MTTFSPPKAAICEPVIYIGQKQYAKATFCNPRHELGIRENDTGNAEYEANVLLLKCRTTFSIHSSKLPTTANGVAASRPPSTGMTTPEIQRDSSLAK